MVAGCRQHLVVYRGIGWHRAISRDVAGVANEPEISRPGLSAHRYSGAVGDSDHCERQNVGLDVPRSVRRGKRFAGENLWLSGTSGVDCRAVAVDVGGGDCRCLENHAVYGADVAGSTATDSQRSLRGGARGWCQPVAKVQAHHAAVDYAGDDCGADFPRDGRDAHFRSDLRADIQQRGHDVRFRLRP
ncbi:hypothetical protein D3C75_815440 [compost metagenome]